MRPCPLQLEAQGCCAQQFAPAPLLLLLLRLLLLSLLLLPVLPLPPGVPVPVQTGTYSRRRARPATNSFAVRLLLGAVAVPTPPLFRPTCNATQQPHAPCYLPTHCASNLFPSKAARLPGTACAASAPRLTSNI